MKDILVVGGGIGGITAALALRSSSARVTLVEREPAFSPVGAGIVLAPNATAILSRLGVDAASYGERVDVLAIRTAEGDTLQRVDLRPWRESHGCSYAFHRAELHQGLIAALSSEVEVRLALSLAELAEDADGVNVRFSDASTRRFDLVVGADGIHSLTRAQAGVEAAVRYSGYTCWRAVCPNPGVREGFEAWGRGSRFGVVLLRGERVYAFLVATAPQRAPDLAWPDGFDRLFGGYGAPCGDVLAAMDGVSLMHHDLEELDEPVWGTARVWLLGDAAHAMTPNLGQGAAMAIEDAFVLASSLAGDLAAARSRYVEARHRRVRKVQLDSRRFGRVAHWQHGAAVWARDRLIRLMPRTVSDRQFLGVVEPGLALARA